MNQNEEYICQRNQTADINDLLLFPRFFEIETIHACNARCRMCTINSWPNRKPKMSFELFEKIINELAQYADIIDTVTLCRDGEPLLDQDLESRIKKLKNIGIKRVVISTNASMLDHERSISLIESGLDEIMFSVDGLTKETFEAIRIGLNFEEIKCNILNFLEIREKKNSDIKVRIRMIVQDLNYDEFDEWRSFWQKQVRKDDKVYGKPVHTWGNQIDISKFLSKKIVTKAPLCIAIWSTCIIHSDGTVPICSVDYRNRYLCGNVDQDSIAELWQSDIMNQFRNKHIQGYGKKISMCQDCYIWDPATII